MGENLLELSGITKVEESSNEVEILNSEIITPIPKDEAEQLTKDIKSTTTALYVLLKRAHDTKAWIALGYKSWTEYIENEFEFSRARSYQLINQANVIEEIESAGGVEVYISEKEARDIKKRLPEITKKIEEDVKEAGLTGDEAEEKVKEIITYDEEDEEKIRSEIDNAENGGKGYQDKDRDIEDDFDYTGEGNAPQGLTQDDAFMYERLVITLQIFEAIPDPESFAQIVNKAPNEKIDVIKSARHTVEWCQKLLEKIT